MSTEISTEQADAELAARIEAVLMVAESPVPVMELATVLEKPTEKITAVLRELQAEYAGENGGRPRGFILREVAGGWRIYSSPNYADTVGAFVVGGQTGRLTQAAVETLAVIAYRQPITRSRISAIRGVDVSGVVRTLVARNLIVDVGQEDSGAFLYATTIEFMERIGINSLEELLPLAPYLPESEQLEEILTDLKERES